MRATLLTQIRLDVYLIIRSHFLISLSGTYIDSWWVRKGKYYSEWISGDMGIDYFYSGCGLL